MQHMQSRVITVANCRGVCVHALSKNYNNGRLHIQKLRNAVIIIILWFLDFQVGLAWHIIKVFHHTKIIFAQLHIISDESHE